MNRIDVVLKISVDRLGSKRMSRALIVITPSKTGRICGVERSVTLWLQSPGASH